MDRSIRLEKIDFTKSLWLIILKQPTLLISVIVSVLYRDLFATFEPFLITTLLEYHNWYFFTAACSLWLFAELNLIALAITNPRFQLSVIHSLLCSTHQQLLVIDPIYHVKRSSGAILAKIERAARGYEDLLDQITFNFAPLCIGIITMTIILGRYSLLLMSVILLCLLTMICIALYFARYVCSKKEVEFIHTDDAFKTVAFENLAQVQLVRAAFATDYMYEQLKQKTRHNAETEQELWRTYSFVSRVLYAIYASSIIVLLAFFIHQIQLQAVSLAQAIGIILAYITSTREIVKIIQPMRKFIRGYVAVKDLFSSIQKFGKQTIPVFDKVVNYEIEKVKPFSVKAENLVFGYAKGMLFNNHSIEISTQNNSDGNNLIGIIGPSGIGKTTLLSILGGQLKPLHGTVLINNTDIYQVGDIMRRQLIALQGQIARNVRGTVRYNLLFGLPEDHGYSDNYLIEILDRVGLKKVLQEHQNLETMLGEGALNISGGQRQRLNFAALYLRAIYYQPALILIDEPTSSLDEISEAAITNMIIELANNAITLVIAHRLKTVEQAVGLIDLSLLSDEKIIMIHSPEKLKEISSYYQQLLQGNANLQ